MPGGSGVPPVRVFGAFAQIAPAGYTGAATTGTAADGERIIAAAVDDVLPFLRALDAHGWRDDPPPTPPETGGEPEEKDHGINMAEA